jgi:hypothetical protein
MTPRVHGTISAIWNSAYDLGMGVGAVGIGVQGGRGMSLEVPLSIDVRAGPMEGRISPHGVERCASATVRLRISHRRPAQP